MPRLSGIGRLVTCASPRGQDQIGEVERAALVWREGRIVWAGPETALPAELADEPVQDVGGALVVPGLIDAHTHLGFGGWRADEFARRLAGESYLDIATGGGGIASTVRATRALDEDALVGRAARFLDGMLALGVTTVEAKSGYGLDLATELRTLRAYRRLAETGPARIVPTCLAAHVVPPEHRDDPEAYVRVVIDEILPAVAREGLARFCDVFVEEGAFTPGQARRILGAGQALGLRPKLHADQLTDAGGAVLAASVAAASADHLERISPEGIAALARAGTVAVTLPLAGLYLDEPPPPARDLIAAGVAVAVATDFNPGTAPSYHLPLALLLACTRQRMTPAEALKGATRYAARAIGLEAETGSIEPGRAADFAVIDASDVEHWLYHHRPNACVATYVEGNLVAGRL